VGKPRILHWGRHISAEAGIEQNHAMIDEALISLDESSYHRRLAQTPGIALVLFSSPACGTCRVVERRLPEAAPVGASLFKVDVREATGLAREFEIFHLPELFLYSHGQFHARLNCEVGATALGAALDKALAMPAEEEP
jgi:thioredoxin 1